MASDSTLGTPTMERVKPGFTKTDFHLRRKNVQLDQYSKYVVDGRCLPCYRMCANDWMYSDYRLPSNGRSRRTSPDSLLMCRMNRFQTLKVFLKVGRKLIVDRGPRNPKSITPRSRRSNNLEARVGRRLDLVGNVGMPQILLRELEIARGSFPIAVDHVDLFQTRLLG